MSPSKGKKPLPRLALIAFGVLFVALFVGFAVAQGIGKPSVPSDAIAVVEDVPGETITVTDCHGDEVENDPGTITKAEFDCSLQQTAAQAGLREVPKPSNQQYEDLKQAAIGDLLDTVWILAEAEDRGVTVSQRQVEAELEQIVTQNFGCPESQDPFDCEEFQKFLDESHFTADDVDLRVRLQILSQDLQQQITEDVPQVSDDEVNDYYEGAKEQFTVPATRDVRVILNRDRAQVEQAKSELEQDDSEASWRRVAREFSTDPASKNLGGLRPSLTEGVIEEPLNTELFAAPRGELVGPVKTPLGFYVFEVEKISAERVQPLEQVSKDIRTQIRRTEQQQAFQQFVSDYGTKWQSRTVCASDFLTERCSNFKGSGHPPTAPPACYEAAPRGGRPAACPAPVAQLVPALPGTVSVLAPQGQQLPQRPRPAGLAAAGGGGLPGATGVPPGTAPIQP